MTNSSAPAPHIRRLIIRCGGHTRDELIAAEALLMLSRTTQPPSPLPRHKNGHKCSLCEKIFASHQALGGHMTYHRRKTIPTTTTTAAINEVMAIMTPPASGDKSDVLSDDADCVGKVRNHEYLGKQVGGHKRKHDQPSSGNESDESKRRLLVLFDQHPCGSGNNRYSAASSATIATAHPDLELDLKLGL